MKNLIKIACMAAMIAGLAGRASADWAESTWEVETTYVWGVEETTLAYTEDTSYEYGYVEPSDVYYVEESFVMFEW